MPALRRSRNRGGAVLGAAVSDSYSHRVFPTRSPEQVLVKPPLLPGMVETRVVLEDVRVRGTARETFERAVAVVGARADVGEAVGLYLLGRKCTRDRLKPKEFARLVADAVDELFGDPGPGEQAAVAAELEALADKTDRKYLDGGCPGFDGCFPGEQLRALAARLRGPA